MEDKNLQLEQFSELEKKAIAIVQEVKDLKIKDVNDTAGYEAVRAGKMKVARQIKETKDARLDMTRSLDAVKQTLMDKEKSIVKGMEETKEILAARQQAIDDARLLEKRKALLPLKKEKLLEIEMVCDDEMLLSMDDAQFNEFFYQKKSEWLEEKQRIADKKREEEEAKLQAERDKLAETQRKLDEQARIAEAEKQARIEAEVKAKRDAEIEKERVIAEAAEAARKAEKEKEDAIVAERLKAEAEKQAIIDKQKADDDARITEEKRKAEEDAKLQAQAKYQKFLQDNKYDTFTDYIMKGETEDILYRKVAVFTK